MKNGIYLLALMLFSLVGCNELDREMKEEWNSKQPKLVVYTKMIDGEKVVVKEEKFYIDGQMEYTGEYNAEGKRHGHWKYFYEDGKPWSEGQFENGKRMGPAKVYYPNGKVRYEGKWENNKEVGVWTFYKQDGTKDNEINYDERNKE